MPGGDKVERALAPVWAKSPGDADQPGTSLMEHTAAVLQRLAAYIKLYRRELKQATGVDMVRVLLYGALLHDFGKVHPGFQAMLRGEGHFGLRHELLSLAFLAALQVPEKEKPCLAAVVALHHRDWWELQTGHTVYFHPSLEADRLAPLQELVSGLPRERVAAMLDWLEMAGEYIHRCTGFSIEPYPVQRPADPFPAAHHIYEGLAVIRALVGTFVQRGGRGVPRRVDRAACYPALLGRGMVISADHLASAAGALPAPGFSGPQEVLDALGLSEGALYPHQQALLDAAGSRILVAPTGSGKTECALLWSAALRREKGMRGRLFLLLPYQASLNAMAIRLRERFGAASTALVHGKTLVRCYQELTEAGYGPDQAQKMARHAAALARLNVAPIRLCTPYQLLRVFFARRAYEAMYCFLLGAQLVFDEIHAYDPEVAAMVLVAAKFFQLYAGAECLFMSATLPGHLESVLREYFSLPRPLRPPADWLRGRSRHRLHLLPAGISEPDTVQRVVEAACQGAVLVVVNRVARAVEMADRLCREGLRDVILLHSRFCPRDRAAIEKSLAPRTGRVLVATQVVEVSLDIDYDTIFTEMAPLEALLQRFGRVNRRGGKGICPVHVCTRLEGGALPYRDAHLQQVARVLEKFLIDKPDGILEELLVQELLDASYPAELRQELMGAVREKMQAFERNFVREMLPLGVQDSDTVRRLQEAWDEQFDGVEILPEALLPEAKAAPTPLDVAQLLVPVSHRQFARLKALGRVRWEDSLSHYVTSCSYSTDTGLIL
ncbi:MAG: CRISPR-associated helicase Cas3' [Bacillota bacterium]